MLYIDVTQDVCSDNFTNCLNQATRSTRTWRPWAKLCRFTPLDRFGLRVGVPSRNPGEPLFLVGRIDVYVCCFRPSFARPPQRAFSGGLRVRRHAPINSAPRPRKTSDGVITSAMGRASPSNCGPSASHTTAGRVVSLESLSYDAVSEPHSARCNDSCRKYTCTILSVPLSAR